MTNDYPMERISIIIPVYNEEDSIARTLGSLAPGEGDEIIVVDGGSTDRTVEIAREFTGMVFISKKGRARQMNFGAGRARGEILFFLHADCIPPENALSLIRESLGDETVVMGAFDIRYSSPYHCYRVVSSSANLRSRLTSIPYGDQGIFLRKGTFESLGGFADIPIMEDIELGRRAKRVGKIAFIDTPLTVSPRRFEKEGLLYGVLRDWMLAFSYSVLGTPPEKLVRHYRDVR